MIGGAVRSTHSEGLRSVVGKVGGSGCRRSILERPPELPAPLDDGAGFFAALAEAPEGADLQSLTARTPREDAALDHLESEMPAIIVNDKHIVETGTVVIEGTSGFAYIAAGSLAITLRIDPSHTPGQIKVFNVQSGVEFRIGPANIGDTGWSDVPLTHQGQKMHITVSVFGANDPTGCVQTVSYTVLSNPVVD